MIEILKNRSNNICELCESSSRHFECYTVPPKKGIDPAECVLICENCQTNIQNLDTADSNYWRCLGTAIWSSVPAIKVLCAHILQKTDTDWSRDLTDNIWLEEEQQQWLEEMNETASVHKDSNGNILANGDSVVLIKDLNVKGAGFTAKRGTSVKNIRLVEDNPTQIEGKVEGQQIVILTQYVKK
jgi:protein PhnA